MQRCVVEANSAVHTRLAALRADLQAKRAFLVSTAATMGLGVVAAGSVPLAVPEEIRITETPRFRRMLTDYQLLAREQLICGTQVHVEIFDRDEAIRVAHRVTPHLPLFLALSASSPFWPDGSDTGYSSVRPLMWIRWPTTGPAAPVSSAAEYDRLVADLVSSGVITDPGMVYFDVRPSSHLPTLELRVCDSCPSVDTITLVTGLYRALVDREVAALRAGDAPPVPSPTLVRAAMWRAARSGMEGDLVDLDVSLPRPAVDILTQFVDAVRPQLEENGDWDLVSQLASDAATRGSSAARQRRVLRRRGKLTDVIDHLLAETAGLPLVGRGRDALAPHLVPRVPVFRWRYAVRRSDRHRRYAASRLPAHGRGVVAVRRYRAAEGAGGHRTYAARGEVHLPCAGCRWPPAVFHGRGAPDHHRRSVATPSTRARAACDRCEQLSRRYLRPRGDRRIRRDSAGGSRSRTRLPQHRKGVAGTRGARTHFRRGPRLHRTGPLRCAR